MLRLALVFCAALVGLGASGCGNIDTVVLSQKRMVSLPEPVGDDELREVPLFFEHSSAVPKGDFNPDHVDSVKLQRLEIVLPDPSKTRALGFIEELRVFIHTPSSPDTLVASGGPLPKDAHAVDLEVEDVELKEYLIAEDAELRAEFVGRQPPEQMDVRIEADFLVDVRVKSILF